VSALGALVEALAHEPRQARQKLTLADSPDRYGTPMIVLDTAPQNHVLGIDHTDNGHAGLIGEAHRAIGPYELARVLHP
jgi:hypothetical protein